jgi:hypothetical protein
MSDREWRGYWWLPGQDQKIPGTLIQSVEDGEVALHLIGGFNIAEWLPVNEQKSALSVEGSFPVILGSSGSEIFTLLGCNARHTKGQFFFSDYITEQDLGIQRALRGIHLDSRDEKIFNSATLHIEYLLGWTNLTTLEAKIELDKWKWTGNQTASTSPIEEVTAVHNEHKFTLNVVFNQFRVEDRPRANERSIANSEWAELDISSTKPVSFAVFDNAAKAIMDLMTLTAHAPAGVIRETLVFTPATEHPAAGRRASANVEVLGRQIHQPKPSINETDRVDYLFTLNDLNFSEVLPKWLDLHNRAWLACSLLFGLSYIQQGYTSSRLLTVATAAESLHRALHPKAKKMYYVDRLKALAAEPDAAAVSLLIQDVPKWASYIKDQRNGMAHGDRDELNTGRARLIYDALEVTRALLGLVLLNRLGLSAEGQTRAVDLPYLQLSRDEFNEAMANI